VTQHFVVVGGSRGLGRAFAETALSAGNAVSSVSRQSRPVARSDRFVQFACDLRDSSSTANVLSLIARERGAFDGIVFCQRYRSAPAQASSEDWGAELAVSLSATKTLIEQSVTHFTPEGPKSIVLVSSVNERLISPHLSPGYHVAKAGLCQLARYYACRLGPAGIRVNAVCPGTFVKPDSEDYYRLHPEAVTRLVKVSPLRRLVSHSDVTNAIWFLLQKQSAAITGQSLTIDGGVSLQWPEHIDAEVSNH
jgi:NAD(P)-dependent dehydrogenase (short-subunit alcohol dehydrogenase family)